MREQELRALADALLGDEDGPVLVPGLGLLGGPVHRGDDGGLRDGGLEQLAQRALVEVIAPGHLVDESLHVGAMDVDGERGAGRGEGGAEQRGGDCGTDGGDECTHQDPISLRWECSDMRMPKPASSVTIDVPP